MFTEALDALDQRRALVFMVAVFVTIAILYAGFKFVTLCVLEHFERRLPQYTRRPTNSRRWD